MIKISVKDIIHIMTFTTLSISVMCYAYGIISEISVKRMFKKRKDSDEYRNDERFQDASDWRIYKANRNICKFTIILIISLILLVSTFLVEWT